MLSKGVLSARLFNLIYD
ncbi:TPA: protein YchT [Escherichia coli]|nr:protein YchT [Escherichia coli]MCL7119949.1 protein YchT [Escherichia coli]UOY77045.1 protein YchT [Escherichia coli]